MSKITNLIGTTWRLDGSALTGLDSEYGIFNVVANGIFSEVGVMSIPFETSTFYCGYFTLPGAGDADNISSIGDSVCIFVTYASDGTTTLENIFYPLALPNGRFFSYEFTITGGTDITNPLFIDFINTYGTLVSAPEPEVPTAEGVKSKLQSLITASNTKTGKSDANLTDAVNTLLEGYGKGGGGGGECSGNHIIEVAELPEVGVEGAIYAVKTFIDVAIVYDGMAMKYIESAGGDDAVFYEATSDTYQDIVVPDGVSMALCYVKDTPEIMLYSPFLGNGWSSFSVLTEMMQIGTLSCLGEITTLDGVDTTKNGYYAYCGLDLYEYTGGQYKRLLRKGELKFTSNGDGTCYVSGLEDYHDAEIVIPSILTSGDTVTGIGEGAFKECSGVTSITIPNNVTSIGKEAFQSCKSLESITIPDSVTSIGNYAFSLCTGLDRITIPHGVTSIGDDAFQFCSYLDIVTIPDSVTSIGNYAFTHCYKLDSITIPNSVTSIGANAFAFCHSLRSITIPDGITSISAYMVYSCYGLQKITIPDSVTSIGQNAFASCSSLTSVTIPNGVTSIDRQAFSNCTVLASITIPDGVTVIDYRVFNNCSNLPSITIPDGVTEIGTCAFEGCTSLTSITFGGTVEQWNAIKKGSSWNNNVPATKVVCSDGEVAL